MAEASIAGSTQPVFVSRRFAPSLQRWGEWLAFFLIVAGVRLWIVASFGSGMPLLDQWDDEGARLLKPYAEGTLSLSQLIAPHNEHRPVLSRLLALGLFALNDQWDARLQMLVNALIATLLTCLVAAIGVKLVAARHRTIVLVTVACSSCLPYAWENTTWAFQSSFYFLGAFSVLAIWGLLRYAPFSLGWFGGAAAALLACVSMGSGFLCAAAVIAVLVAGVVAGRAQLREQIATFALCVFVIAVGLALRPDAPQHDDLRATSAIDWLAVFARALSWPYPQFPLACAVMYLPVALLVMTWMRRKDADAANSDGTQVIVALAAWVALQAAAIAYARGGGLSANYIASRYTGILTLGAVANLLAVLKLTEQHWRGGGPTRAAHLLAVAWVAFVFIGGAAVSYKAFSALRARADQVREAETHLRSYLATGDARELAADSSRIAYPWPDRLAALLNDSTIRRILPAAIRPPLDVEPEGTTGPFVEESGVWSSQPANGANAGVEMRTRVLRSLLPYLRMQMRGSLGKGISLRVRDESTGEQHGIEFARSSDWRTGFVEVPEAFRLIAHDEHPQRALTFTDPIEIGRLSVQAERVLSQSFYILVAGLAVLVLLAARQSLLAVSPRD